MKEIQGRNPDGDVRAADRQVETAVPEESHIEYLVKSIQIRVIRFGYFFELM